MVAAILDIYIRHAPAATTSTTVIPKYAGYVGGG